jgi:hypothetical protein
MIPQINSISEFPCSQVHILARWRLETELTRCHLFSIMCDGCLKRLPQLSPQLAMGLPYIASGRIQQKTPFPNNPSIVACVFVAAGRCLPSVYSGSTIPASYHNILQRFVTRFTDVPSQTKYFRDGCAVIIWNKSASSPNRKLSLCADYYSFYGQYVMHF